MDWEVRSLANEHNYQYPDWTQNQENEREKDYSFWNNWYQVFNPPSPVATPQNMGDIFHQGGANTQAFAQSQMKGGAPGSLDVQGMNRGINRNAEMGGNQANFESALKAFQDNAGNAERAGQQGLGRYLNIGNTNDKINQMKTDRQGSELSMADYIKSLNARQANQETPWEKILGAGIGTVGGTLANDALNPIEKQPDYYDALY